VTHPAGGLGPALVEWLPQPPFAGDPYWGAQCALAYHCAGCPTECLRLLDSDPAIEVAPPQVAVRR